MSRAGGQAAAGRYLQAYARGRQAGAAAEGPAGKGTLEAGGHSYREVRIGGGSTFQVYAPDGSPVGRCATWQDAEALVKRLDTAARTASGAAAPPRQGQRQGAAEEAGQ